MLRPVRFLQCFLLLSVITVSVRGNENIESLFKERVRSVVAVSFIVQHETEREPVKVIGVYLDEEGHAILLDYAIPGWLPPDRLRDFKVRQLGSSGEGYPAIYLGQDNVTGFHFIKITSEEGRKAFTPVRSYEVGDVRIGQPLWGIGVMGEAWDYLPYFLGGRLSVVVPLPWDAGFSDTPVATPGSLVFDYEGRLVGWASRPGTEERLIYMDGERFSVGLQSVRESNGFMMAAPFLHYAKRIPEKPVGVELPWLGIAGILPLDKDVAAFMGLENQGALVVSDVIKESPAEVGGLRSKDIIVAVDGVPLSKFRPDHVLIREFERILQERKPGDKLKLDVIRDDQPLTLELTFGRQPTSLKEAARSYFPRLGFTAREYTLYDGVSQRELRAQGKGVFAEFVKPNSPVNTADLQFGDWIQEIDGQVIENYDQAVKLLEVIEKDTSRNEAVMLIRRGNETKVLRIKLR